MEKTEDKEKTIQKFTKLDNRVLEITHQNVRYITLGKQKL